MRTMPLLALVIGCATPVCAAAQEGGSPAIAGSPTSTAVKADPDDKVICRTDTPLGSRIAGTRVCHTRRDWNQLSSDGRAALEAQTRYSQGAPH